MAAFASFIAGTISIFGMAFLAPPLAETALRFGPPEFFAMMAFGMTAVLYLSSGSMSRALMMAAVGFILGCVGVDKVYGRLRFTYEVVALTDGIGLAQWSSGFSGYRRSC